MKQLIVLGSTGSIGTQTLKVVENRRDDWEIIALACGTNMALFQEQIEKYRPKAVAVAEEADARDLQRLFPRLEVFWGPAGLKEIVRGEGHVVVNGLMGIKGLEPTVEAIASGKDIALANKETLVAGGKSVMDLVKKHGVKLTPIDSEHSAIFQCLQGNDSREVKRVILTASGGPFRTYDYEKLKEVSPEEALKHPKWTMGQKITIDSATLMNKGLEVMEARWLFDLDYEDIQVVIHPQSIIHSMVEYRDGAIMAQLGRPDMGTPIAYALSHPGRWDRKQESFDFIKESPSMTFEEPDLTRFPCLALAYEAGRRGGSYPVVLNGANEVLVELFLKKKIDFLDIPGNLELLLQDYGKERELSVEEILDLDREIRRITLERIRKR